MSQVFEPLSGMLSELDVLLSFADLASSCPTPYTRPDITSSVIICYFNFSSQVQFSCQNDSLIMHFYVKGCGRYCIESK